MESKTFQRDEKGATTLETALTIFPAMLLILGIIQLSVLALNMNSLQFALNTAARWGSVGQKMPGLTREASIESKIRAVASSISLDTSDLTISICPALDPTCSVNNAGGANSYFIIRATKANPLKVIGLGSLGVSAKVIIKNEPF